MYFEYLMAKTVELSQFFFDITIISMICLMRISIYDGCRLLRNITNESSCRSLALFTWVLKHFPPHIHQSKELLHSEILLSP